MNLFAVAIAAALLAVAPHAGAQDGIAGGGSANKAPAKKPVANKPLTAEQKAAIEEAKAKAAAKRAERAAKLEEAKRERAEKRAAQRKAAEEAAKKRAEAREKRRAAQLEALAAKKAAREAKLGAKHANEKTDGAGEEPKTKLKGLLKHFQDELSPHGAWIEHPAYGLIWIPNETEVGKNFSPYKTDGRWAVTDNGDWAWVSNKDWGKIPFHYGRWIWTRDKNWAWIPDREYAPAWVAWRLGDPGTPYVGWAPMAPTHYWVDGAPQRQSEGILPFTFVAARHLFSPNLAKHAVTNRKLGARVQDQSTIFTGHVEGDESPANAPLKAASPPFDLARIPVFAIPKSRMPVDHEAIKPIVLAAIQTITVPIPNPNLKLQQGDAKDADGSEESKSRFATPPDGDSQEQPGADNEGARSADSRRAREAKRTKRVKKRIVVRQGKQGKPRYRCKWTNTRPRIWRCGY